MKQYKVKKPLQLINDGKLEIVFLGTGSQFTKTLFNNNFIIIKDNKHILVDFGMNAPIALDKVLGLNPQDIDCLLITHSHADHTGGVEYLAIHNRYIAKPIYNKPKLKLIVTKEFEKKLWNKTLAGGMEWNEVGNNIKKKTLELTDYFDIYYPEKIISKDRSRFVLNYEGIKIEIFRTNHIPDSATNPDDAYLSYGLFIDDKILITCDSKYDKELIDYYGPKSDYIFHDCSFLSNPVHASLKEIRRFKKTIKEKMFLMHYSDDWKNQNLNDFLGLVKQGVRYIFD